MQVPCPAGRVGVVRPLLVHEGPRVAQNAVIPVRVVPRHDERARGAGAASHRRAPFGVLRQFDAALRFDKGQHLFFDELRDVSGPMQIALLRLLDRGEYCPVGSKRPLHADVRIVGATNQDLQALVLQGRFSDDLLYRISTITLRIPGLSARVQNFQG